MKIRFPNNYLEVDGEIVGHIHATGWKTFVYADVTHTTFGENRRKESKLLLCIKDVRGSSTAVGRAKRWLRAALTKAGSVDALYDAVATQGPLDFCKIPRARRTQKTRRDELRLEDWARRTQLGRPVGVFHGPDFELEKTTQGVLIDIASEGYTLDVDGQTVLIPYTDVQSIYPRSAEGRAA